ncbi:hypothetical protein, partial [Leptospira borgpetersenii]|uniref:hypothetical protein n=1 Tax=Leptospira borgpetersenii TaxID=174 RepID=UPI0027DC45CC
VVCCLKSTNFIRRGSVFPGVPPTFTLTPTSCRVFFAFEKTPINNALYLWMYALSFLGGKEKKPTPPFFPNLWVF